MNRRMLLLLVCLLAHGFGEPPHQPVDYDVEAIFDQAAYHPEWNDRNADIYRFLLSQLEAPSADRIYFITNTPRSHWDEKANWSVIPQSELDPFPNAALYHPASQAHHHFRIRLIFKQETAFSLPWWRGLTLDLPQWGFS